MHLYSYMVKKLANISNKTFLNNLFKKTKK